MAIRDYIKVEGQNPQGFKRINDFLDWVDNNDVYEISDSAKAAAELHNTKIIIKTEDNLPIGFDGNPPTININFVHLKKMKYSDDKGNSYHLSLASTIAHELKHAEDASLTPEAIEKYIITTRELMLATRFVDNKAEGEAKEILKEGSPNNSRHEDILLGQKVADILMENSKRALDNFSKDSKFITNVQNYELEPIRAANIIREKYENAAPRSEDYLDASRANLHLLEEGIINNLVEKSYTLNLHPEDFAECSIPTKDLIAINQEKTTLKEAGVSPDADLSGCVLVAPDNIAGNKEYRDSVISKNNH